MAKEHSILRSAMDSIEEAHRLTERYNKRDVAFKMTVDDLHTLRRQFTRQSAIGRVRLDFGSGPYQPLTRPKHRQRQDSFPESLSCLLLSLQA